LLQGFGELASALLLGLEQPYILNCDHRLVGESGDELNLLLAERLYLGSCQKQHADRKSLAQKRNTERCTIVPEIQKHRGHRIRDRPEHQGHG
jgi:hypothetical protein